MSGSTMLTLKDGYKVSSMVLAVTQISLEELHKKEFFAFYDLVEKCKNSGYKFVKHPFGLGDPKDILKKYDLIAEDETVDDDIREIVVNSVKGYGLSLTLVSPLQSKQITKIGDKDEGKTKSEK